jgi:hypothetical protein
MLDPIVRWEYPKHIEQHMWCRQTFGSLVTDGWRCRPNWNYDMWQFDSEEKASLFALRWV